MGAKTALICYDHRKGIDLGKLSLHFETIKNYFDARINMLYIPVWLRSSLPNWLVPMLGRIDRFRRKHSKCKLDLANDDGDAYEIYDITED